MGNLMDYRKARALLRLGAYEAWQVECIANLLRRHDERAGSVPAPVVVARPDPPARPAR